MAYTSYLKRAVRTLDIVLSTLDLDWIPVEKSWRLNEKHYGVLQGLDKSRTAELYGQEQVRLWRRDYDTAPDPLPADDRRNPRFDSRYASVPGSLLPLTESLRQTVARTLPYWQCVIYPALARYDSILVVAHGNSLRGIVKHLKGISDSAIAHPTSSNLTSGSTLSATTFRAIRTLSPPAWPKLRPRALPTADKARTANTSSRHISATPEQTTGGLIGLPHSLQFK